MATPTPYKLGFLYELGPSNGSLTVHTGRAGMAARAGHDLVIEAERWSASVMLTSSTPREWKVCATVDAKSLQVREGRGGVKPLTDADREEIRRNLDQKVLRTDRYPEITFTSKSVDIVDERRWQVVGDLTVAGTSSTVRIPIQIDSAEDGTRLRATVRIAQSDFGIKPYSALMGSLKVADEVEIRAEAQTPGQS